LTEATLRQRLAAVGATVFERGWLSSNNILFQGGADGDAVLVDSGHVRHARQTLALVERALGDAPLAAVVNTHLHSDHCGGNGTLARRFGCEVAVPHGSFAHASEWNEDALTYRATDQTCDRFVPTRAIADGEHLRIGKFEWRAVAAPGHDDLAMMYFQPNHGVLLSGDALWESRVAVLFPTLEGKDGVGSALRTLDTIESLDPRVVVPGHGAAFATTADALRRSRSRLLEFAEQPSRHTRYALKALIVFRVMELPSGSTSRSALLAWLPSSTPTAVSA
jgi:glyoxylase-like metal-dependent hydrolase (beta-lactamase superfamily II)